MEQKGSSAGAGDGWRRTDAEGRVAEVRSTQHYMFLLDRSNNEREEEEEDVARRGAAVFSQGPARGHKVRLCLPPRVPDKGILVCAGGGGGPGVRREGAGWEGGWVFTLTEFI